jgi:hypothetical protein
MIRWLLENLGIVVVVVLFAAQIVRGLLQTKQDRAPPQMRREDDSEERRVREVQEQIRRQIAARRGEQPATGAPPPLREPEPQPVPRAETTQLPEPFGGPLGRMLEELQRKAQQLAPPPPPPPPVLVDRKNTAELERQQRLGDELKALEEARHVSQRRAAHVVADQQAVAESEPVLRSNARRQLLADLADASSIRRAVVLREVLGPPVGLR